MITSGVKPRATSAGSTSAALPSTPIERATPSQRVAPGRFDRLVDVGRALVEVLGREPLLDPGRIDLDDQRDAAVHGHREGLGAAHPAQTGGGDDLSAQASR